MTHTLYRRLKLEYIGGTRPEPLNNQEDNLYSKAGNLYWEHPIFKKRSSVITLIMPQREIQLQVNLLNQILLFIFNNEQRIDPEQLVDNFIVNQANNFRGVSAEEKRKNKTLKEIINNASEYSELPLSHRNSSVVRFRVFAPLIPSLLEMIDSVDLKQA